jgi:hypothetical protein
MNEGQQKFKRQVFEQTLRRYIQDIGVDPQTVDFAEFDFDSYNRIIDLLNDVASNPKHPYNSLAVKILKYLDKYSEYYGWPEDVMETMHEEEENESKEIRELRAAIELLEDRIRQLEDSGPASSMRAGDEELKNEISQLNKIIDMLRAELLSLKQREQEHEEIVRRNAEFTSQLFDRMAQSNGSGRRDGPRAGNNRHGPASKGIYLKGLLSLAVIGLLTWIIIPMAAYTNQWGPVETFVNGMVFVLICAGLMLLEGLWVKTTFSGPANIGKGFVTGYIYSQYQNPYRAK